MVPESGNVPSKMARREVSVPLRHLRTCPTPKLLQHVKRSTRKHMQSRPGMPQVVPSEVVDPCPLQCRPPGRVVNPSHRLAAKEIGRAALKFLGELSEQESLTRYPVRSAAGFPSTPPCRACPACRCCGTE
jgi:hypothetical protein